MRQLLSGNAAARGSALGRARVRLPHALDIEEARIGAGDVDVELARFHDAVATVRAEMRELRERMALSNVQIGVHLSRLIAMEYVLAHRGGRGSSFVYELLFDGAADEKGPRLPGLIDVESLLADAAMTANRKGEKAGCEGPIRPQNGGNKGHVRPLESVQNANNGGAFDDSAVADTGNARRRSAANGTSSYAQTSSLAASSLSR